jgi:hypothetical protein
MIDWVHDAVIFAMNGDFEHLHMYASLLVL